MAIIGVNDGHTISGPGSGAVGIISESKVTREVGNLVRQMLAQRGHKVINCTIDKASTSREALGMIVNQANRQELDWFISIHFNAGEGRGTEVYTYEGRQYQDAIDVCKNISELGFTNRGVKKGTGLYVVRRTKAKSMLIEVCFVDSSDANKYLQMGPKPFAEAIVNALCRTIGGSYSNASSNVSSPSVSIDGIIGTCTGNGVRVRSSMDTNSSSNILGHLNKGDKIKLFKDRGDWYETYYGAHGGYVSKKYISF